LGFFFEKGQSQPLHQSMQRIWVIWCRESKLVLPPSQNVRRLRISQKSTFS
jgi:hypothetical protein